MIITNISDFSLQFDEELSLLRIEWASGNDMRTFRASAEQMLVLSERLQVRRLLLNMNTLPDISVYDQVWLGAHWIPAVAKSTLERVVLVNHRRRVHNQLAIESLLAQMLPIIRFDIQYFPQSGPGLHWLSDYSDRLPALLAEWDAVHGPASPGSGANKSYPLYQSRP